jgi:hypothetical protein
MMMMPKRNKMSDESYEKQFNRNSEGNVVNPLCCKLSPFMRKQDHEEAKAYAVQQAIETKQ